MLDLEKSKKKAQLADFVKNPLRFRTVSFDSNVSSVSGNAFLSWSALIVSVFFAVSVVVDPVFFVVVFVILVVSSAIAPVSIFCDKMERDSIRHILYDEAQKAVNDNEYVVNLHNALKTSYRSFSPKSEEIKNWSPHHIKWVQKEWDKAMVRATTEALHEASGKSASNKSQLENMGNVDTVTRKKIAYFIDSMKELQEQDNKQRSSTQASEQELFDEQFKSLVQKS